jgi:hypothetical protein
MRSLLAFVIGLVIASGFARAADGVPRPEVSIAKPGQCIAPAAEMRRNHMELLKHRRDQTVRAGVRGGANAASLNACIDCHAGQPGAAVTGSKTAFCEGCHSYAAVKLDCWDCHQPVSGYKAAASSTPAGGLKP